MISFKQQTANTSGSNYSQLDIAISEGGISCAYSRQNGRDFEFTFNDASGRTLGDITRAATSQYSGIKIRAFLIDAEHTLIPHELFDFTNEEDYLYYNAPSNDVVVSTDSVYSQSLKNVFGIRSERFSGVSGMEGIRIQHYLSPLMTFLPGKENEVFVAWLHDHIAIMGVKDGNLLAARCHACIDMDEALYHTLLIYNLCGFDRNEDKLTMMGRFEKDSDLFALFYRYIRNIELPSIPGYEGDNAHMFFDMYLMSKYI